MKDKYFNFTDVLGYGWRTMKTNFWFFVGVGFLFLIITYIPSILDVIAIQILSKSSFALFRIVTVLLSWAINIVLGIGILKIALSFCDGQKPTVGTLFDAWDCFWRYFGAAILYFLICLGGFILLIIPGIIWAIKYSQCLYFVVDRGLGPVQALKASGRTTMGVKWELFGFNILCALINWLGVICLIVGIFATYPTVIVAMALVYRQLSAQTPELAEFGIDIPSPELPSILSNERESDR